MSNNRDDEDGEVVDDEAAGEPDFELINQEALAPREAAKYPHLILIKSNERKVESALDHDPPGWPDF